jgi:uncharacterized Zn ribbon protein
MQREEQDLLRRLRQLTIEKKKIENRLSELEQNKPREEEEEVKDRDGSIIKIGDTVLFITKGKYQSSRGKVTRINTHRVTARDKRGNSISRAPYNLRRIETNNTYHE